MAAPEYEERHIREYMYSQGPNDEIHRLEKVATHHILGRRHAIWDVHTGDDRWWVITTPTNLYSQAAFESMDFALTFHIGLTTRVMANHEPPGTAEERDRLTGPWRRWEQAAEALEKADEAEEFQAVGMRCRECLLAFIREVATEEMVPAGEETPQRSNFLRWSEYVADAIAGGGSAARIRAYLKALARTTWELVNWLTHATNATLADGRIAVDATQNILAAYGMAVVRHERGEPDRCPVCSSYRLTSDYRPELGEESPYITLCESCGWENIPDGVEE